MEDYIINEIRILMFDINLSHVYSIYRNNSKIYDSGINAQNHEIEKLQDLYNYNNFIFNEGIKINGTKYVVVDQIIANNIYIHGKHKDDGIIIIYNRYYTFILHYTDEILPMYHENKIEKIRKNTQLINNLLCQ